MKPTKILATCISVVFAFSIYVLPTAAKTKSQSKKEKASKRDTSRIEMADLLDEAYKRGLIDQNGHLFTAQEIKTQHKVLTTQQLAHFILPSIVRLTIVDAHGNATAQGSGFVVGKNMIATNVHVILGAHSVTANFQNGRSEAVKGLVTADVSRDLALIYADTTGVRPLLFASESARIGDPVVAVGSPEGLSGSISTGIISGMRTYNGSNVIQTTAPISPGSSGGALLDVHGQVLGITSFFYKSGQNLNFAYKAYYLRRMLPYRAVNIRTWKQIEDWDKPNSSARIDSDASNSTPTDVASKNTYTASPLTGLKGVYVLIGNINPDVKKDGLDADQIKVEVELRLRKVGITVFDKIDSHGNDSMAVFEIDVSTTKNGNGLYGFDLSANLSETISLLRPNPCLSSGTTWTAGYVGISDSDGIANTLRQDIDDATDRFANDYLAQNPK